MNFSFAQLFEGACHRLPERSVEGSYFCYRCSALYTSLAISGLLYIFLFKKVRPSWKTLLVGVFLCVPMVGDVLSVRYNIYQSEASIRIITGGLMGIGIATLFSAAFTRVGRYLEQSIINTSHRKRIVFFSLFVVLFAPALYYPMFTINILSSIGLIGGSSIVQGMLIFMLFSRVFGSRKKREYAFAPFVIVGLVITFCELEVLKLLPPGMRNVFAYIELVLS